jgi:hypothetical protein
MKRIIFPICFLLVISTSLFSQNVGIGTTTPAAKLDVKSTSGYVSQFNGIAPMYIGLFESDVYRGYLGSYSGALEDVDFGTGSGNANGKLHLTIQAVPKLTINASGNVGIGTTTPNYKLHINTGDLFVESSIGRIIFGFAATNQWHLGSNNGGADLKWYTSTDGGVNITARHYFSQNGNVGIGGFTGTLVPQARLHVIGSGSTSSTNNLILKNSLGDTLLRMRDDGFIGIGYNGTGYGRTLNLGGSGMNFYTAGKAFGGAIFPTDTSLVFWSNSGSNNYLVLQPPSWGNTGIGTYSPDAKLDVKSATNFVSKFNGIAPMYIGLYEADVYRGYLGSFAGSAEDVDFGTASGNAAGKLHLTIQASPKLTINASGNVGIGITSPNYKLHVNGTLFIQSSAGSIIFGFEGSNQWQISSTGGGADMKWYSTPDGTTLTSRHYFKQNGDVGIGGFSGSLVPQARLHVIGSGSTNTTNNLMLKNSVGDTLLRMNDAGDMGIGYNGSTYGRTLNLGGDGMNFYTANEAAFGGAIFPTDTSLVLWSDLGSSHYVVLQPPTYGNVGIGTYSPDAKLDVSGTVMLGVNGTIITNMIKVTVNVNLASVAANSSLIQTFAVTNAVTTSTVAISPAIALSDGLVIAYARVSAANTIEVKFTNVTGVAIDPGQMNYYITVIQ